MSAKLTIRHKETGVTKYMYAVDAREWANQKDSLWQIMGAGHRGGQKIEPSPVTPRSGQLTKSGVDLNTYTAAELKDFADEEGIDYHRGVLKRDLIDMLIDVGFDIEE